MVEDNLSLICDPQSMCYSLSNVVEKGRGGVGALLSSFAIDGRRLSFAKERHDEGTL